MRAHIVINLAKDKFYNAIGKGSTKIYFGLSTLNLIKRKTKQCQTLTAWFRITRFCRITVSNNYNRLSLNGHLYKMDTSVKRTPWVGPCISLLPLFDNLSITWTPL